MAEEPLKASTTPSTPRKRLSYWYVDRITPRHRDLASALLSKGYEIRFFTTAVNFFAEVRVRRAGIILIDDVGSKPQIESVIQGCMSMPELQGVRLILTTTGQNPDLRQMAAWGAFRDILSMSMDDSQFVRRFVFSTAGKSSGLLLPVPHLVTNHNCIADLPVRLVWLTDKRIRIEGRLSPPVGTTLTLQGALAESMGIPFISIKVEALHKSFLLYRFSDAIVGSWSAPPESRHQVEQTLDFLKAKNLGQRRRVFVAAHSSAFRTQVLTYLKGPHFEVKAALQKQSIVDEPRFFNPDVIFIEDTLCHEGGIDRLKAMVEGVTNELTIVVKGTSIPRDILQKSVGANHHLVIYPILPANIGEQVLNKYANGSHRHATLSDQEALHILPEDKHSFAHIQVGATLTRVHPDAVQVALPFPVGNFGLWKIQSPFFTKALGRSVYAKITATHQNATETPAAQFAVDCHLADTSKEDKRLLTASIVQYFSEQMLRSPVTASLHGSEETREDGALSSEANAKADGNFAEPVAQVVSIDSNRQQKVAIRPISTSRRAKPRKKPIDPFEPLKYFAAFCAVGAAFCLFMWLVVKIASTDYQKSGGEYTNSLKKMAPDRFRSGESDGTGTSESH